MSSSMPTKEQCETEHTRVHEYLMKNFVENLKEHKEKEHKFFIQGSIHGACRDLVLDKQLVIYLILGSNPFREAWGNLKEKYQLEPIKYVLRNEVVKKGKEVLDNYGFKVYFGDRKGNGDFHMKVDFYPYPAEKSEDGSDGFKKVERKFKPKAKREWVSVAARPPSNTVPKIPVIKATKKVTPPAASAETLALENRVKELEAKLASLTPSSE